MALIKTIEEVRKYTPMSASSKVELMPSVDIAEQKHLLPILGLSLYDLLQTEYDADTLSDLDKLLLAKCQAVTVPFAYLEDMALRQVWITDAGLVAFENESSRKAYKYEYNNAIDALYARAYDAQNFLIEFLKLNKASYPEWSTSPYNTPNGFFMIQDGSDLCGLVALQQPHRVYMMLRPIFLQLTEEWLKPNLSDAYYAALNSRLQANTLLDEEKQIITKLRLATARMAMVCAADDLAVNFNVGHGFTVVDKNIVDTTDQGKTAASDQQLLRFKTNHETAARTALEQVKTYMNTYASADAFPEYFTSDVYKDPTVTSKKIDNTQNKGLVGF